MSATLARWQGGVDEQLREHGRDLAEHDSRIRGLERFMWKTVGAALVGAMAGSCAATVIAYLIVGAIQGH